MKVFVCSVCGQEVSKRKSLAMPDGSRACKSHSEAQSFKDERIERKKKEDRARQARQNHRREFHSPLDMKDPNTICWKCLAEGVSVREMMFRGLISFEKAKLRLDATRPDGYSFMDLLEQSHKENQTTETVLYMITLGAHDVERVSGGVRQRYSQLVMLGGGIVNLCKPCMDKLNLKWELPKISSKQLQTGMVMANIIRPTTEALAKIELDTEAITN